MNRFLLPVLFFFRWSILRRNTGKGESEYPVSSCDNFYHCCSPHCFLLVSISGDKGSRMQNLLDLASRIQDSFDRIEEISSKNVKKSRSNLEDIADETLREWYTRSTGTPPIEIPRSDIRRTLEISSQKMNIPNWFPDDSLKRPFSLSTTKGGHEGKISKPAGYHSFSDSITRQFSRPNSPHSVSSNELSPRNIENLDKETENNRVQSRVESRVEQAREFPRSDSVSLTYQNPNRYVDSKERLQLPVSPIECHAQKIICPKLTPSSLERTLHQSSLQQVLERARLEVDETRHFDEPSKDSDIPRSSEQHMRESNHNTSAAETNEVESDPMIIRSLLRSSAQMSPDIRLDKLLRDFSRRVPTQNQICSKQHQSKISGEESSHIDMLRIIGTKPKDDNMNS